MYDLSLRIQQWRQEPYVTFYKYLWQGMHIRKSSVSLVWELPFKYIVEQLYIYIIK
jgi:hypothetical protein